jgi:hypothetical protein
MTRDELIKEVTEFIKENVAEDDKDVDPSDVGSQLEEHLTALAEEEEVDEDNGDDEAAPETPKTRT